MTFLGQVAEGKGTPALTEVRRGLESTVLPTQAHLRTCLGDLE